MELEPHEVGQTTREIETKIWYEFITEEHLFPSTCIFISSSFFKAIINLICLSLINNGYDITKVIHSLQLNITGRRFALGIIGEFYYMGHSMSNPPGWNPHYFFIQVNYRWPEKSDSHQFNDLYKIFPNSNCRNCRFGSEGHYQFFWNLLHKFFD